jgi:hypothetical protein
VKTLSMTFSVAFALASTAEMRAQGTFLNLDFEMAQISPRWDFTDAFPHWQGFAAGSAVSMVIYNGVLLDSPQIGIWDANADPNFGVTCPPLFGAYSAYLMADAGPWPSPDAELAQTGTVPADARSIAFATTSYSLLPNPDLRPEYWQLDLLFNGQRLPYVKVMSQLDFTIWGADVSAYAGQTVELRFLLHTAYPPNSPPPYDVGVAIGLDEILFSPVPIPEPGSVGLFVSGLALLGARLLRRGQRCARGAG